MRFLFLMELILVSLSISSTPLVATVDGCVIYRSFLLYRDRDRGRVGEDPYVRSHIPIFSIKPEMVDGDTVKYAFAHGKPYKFPFGLKDIANRFVGREDDLPIVAVGINRAQQDSLVFHLIVAGRAGLRKPGDPEVVFAEASVRRKGKEPLDISIGAGAFPNPNDLISLICQ